MAKSRYSDLSKDELLKKIAQLEKKRYGLVWEDKPEEVAERCERELPVLVHQPDKEIAEDPDGPTNLLIEGDNYHALFALNFTHRRKIDVIYIDPPYNTGAKNWTYNNAFVDANDRYRHSKWLSMMSKRLRLAKPLLTENGIICVAIDDYEVPRLTILLEEIFGEANYLGTVPIRNNPSGRSTVRGFSVAHEYALFFAKSEKARISRLERTEQQIARYDHEDSVSKYEWVNFRKHGGANANRTARRRLFYPIFANVDGKLRIPKMNWKDISSEWEILESPKSNEEVIFPINGTGEEKTWKRSHLRVIDEPDEFTVRKDQKGNLGIYIKSRVDSSGMLPLTWFDKAEYSSTDYGTNLLAKIFGATQVFSYPKSLFAVIDCLKVATSKKDALILDFFAGSATTGQAVLEMNKADGGKRRFILSTNNENKIAEEVSYERLKHVINGNAGFDTSKQLVFETKLNLTAIKNIESTFDQIEQIMEERSEEFGKFSTKVEDEYLRVYGVLEDDDSKRPANLKYFTTDFVPFVLTDNDKRVLVSRSTELLCIAEDTFEKVAASKRKNEWAIFKNAKHSMAIIYDEDAIDDCIEKLNKLQPKGTTAIYVFSYDKDYDLEDFAGLAKSVKVKIKAIPEAILNVYRRNAKLRKK
ncbi:MAG: site-specific DNA-methyltransferase [Acidobacteria bacterium]|nr:site-specific DNA-methyltransferase [Acidobacteriota bacterium]